MNRDAHLRLAFAGMHPDRKGTELAKRGGPEQVLGAIVSERLQVPDHARQSAAVPADQRRVELAEMGVSVVMPGDAGYPSRLAAIPDRPDVLFVRGVLPPDAGVAVVGSRRATRYGKTLAGAFGHALGRRGWAVVSGLARGIDAAAHQGAVDAAATAVGVLGCGIDRWYPAANAALGRQILATGGAIVSEYPPGTPPDGWRFPPRNRIISGLAGVVVVVEAAVKGGALITAAHGARAREGRLRGSRRPGANHFGGLQSPHPRRRLAADGCRGPGRVGGTSVGSLPGSGDGARRGG